MTKQKQKKPAPVLNTDHLSQRSKVMVEAVAFWDETWRSMFTERIAIVMEGTDLEEDDAVAIAFESTRKLKDHAG